MKNWTLKKTTEVFQSRPFNVLKKFYDKPDNKGSFNAFVLQQPNWVNIIALTPEQKILLIRQYRFGIDHIELEIPGGCIDPDEAPEHAAARELEEETGYRAEKIHQIGVVNANPAIQMNQCYTFLAENATSSGKVHWDPDELIEMELATLTEVKKYITAGKITNAYIIAAFYWLECRKKEI